MVRDSVKALQKIGQMNEETIHLFIERMDAEETPINAEEAKVLAALLPEKPSYGVDWSLLHLIETSWPKIGREGYKELIGLCPSAFWKNQMLQRLG